MRTVLDPIYPVFRTTHRFTHVRLGCGFLGARQCTPRMSTSLGLVRSFPGWQTSADCWVCTRTTHHAGKAAKEADGWNRSECECSDVESQPISDIDNLPQPTYIAYHSPLNLQICVLTEIEQSE